MLYCTTFYKLIYVGSRYSKCQIEKNDDIFKYLDRETNLLLIKNIFRKIRLLAQAVNDFDIFDTQKRKKVLRKGLIFDTEASLNAIKKQILTYDSKNKERARLFFFSKIDAQKFTHAILEIITENPCES